MALGKTPSFLLPLLLLAARHGVSDKGAFSSVLTGPAVDPVHGVSLESTVPAIDLALQYVSNATNLLPNVTLSYNHTQVLECPVRGTFLEDRVADTIVGLLGYSCSSVEDEGLITTPAFNVTPLIQFTPTSARALFDSPDSNSSRDQPSLFNVYPTAGTYAEAVLAFVHQFGWQRLLVITDTGAGEMFFINVLNRIEGLLREVNITFFETGLNRTSNSLDIPEDVRIIFLNVNSSDAIEALCKADFSRLHFPSYIWITYEQDFQSLAANSACNRDVLTSFLDGVFTLLPALSREPQRNAVFSETTEVIENVMRADGFSTLSYFAFDAVLVLAQAINDTLAGWSNNSPDWSFCEEENEEKKSSLSKCFVRQKILNINITGLTGEISFNSEGNRVINHFGLLQRRDRGEGFPSSEQVAIIAVNASDDTAIPSDFKFLNRENETTLFRGPIPPDGTPVKNISVQPLAVMITFYVLASLGIVFAIICFFFNIIFRKRKIVKLISPNLNYFVVIGAIMLYGMIYLRVYNRSQTLLYNEIRCNVQIFLTCIGYAFCFAPVLMKMWRVYYIFHSPSPTKKAVKDWHLLLGTSILIGIITVIVVIGYAVPAFRTNPALIEDVERPEGRTEDGIRIKNCIYQCYGLDVSLVWVGVEYAYLVIIQVAAFVLAVLNWKVTIKVLNDAKEMMVIVYTSSIILIILGVFTLGLGTRLILNETLFNLGTFIATTVFLSFTFIPKMVDLYRDPHGEGIFGKTTEDKTTSGANKDRSLTLSVTI